MLCFIRFNVCNHFLYVCVIIRHAILIIRIITPSLFVIIYPYDHLELRIVLCVSSIHVVHSDWNPLSWIQTNSYQDRFTPRSFALWHGIFQEKIFFREAIPYTGNTSWRNEWAWSSYRKHQKSRNEQFLQNRLYHFITPIICSQWTLIYFHKTTNCILNGYNSCPGIK